MYIQIDLKVFLLVECSASTQNYLFTVEVELEKFLNFFHVRNCFFLKTQKTCLWLVCGSVSKILTICSQADYKQIILSAFYYERKYSRCLKDSI